ncbi:LamG domain-containing protein [Kamptonema formosum]|uniref:LamG domain-containing protein n=1 Tax=Kamptonema formosum TaxID=331992 RepID=UPI000349CCD8|nr:LamG domain-containing protein [Oscillatoria sp. PCC 10802]
MTLTGQFEVPVSSDTGTEFTNSQSTEVAYTFSASGTWTPDKNNPSLEGCTAEGFPSLNPYVQAWYQQNLPAFGSWTKYSGQTPYALVAESKTTGAVTEVGKKATIVLQPGETLRFVVNDWTWDYGNNSGSLKVSWSGVSLVSKVMVCDGDGDYVQVPYSAQLNPSQFTVTCWAKVTGGQGKFRSPVTSRDGKNGLKGYKLYASDNNKWQTWVGNGSSWQSAVGPDVVLNTWTHVAATYDGTNLKLYVNGNLAGTLATAYVPNTAFPLRIGAGASEQTPPCYYFFGSIAEVSVWKVARTAEQIKADMSKRLTGKEANLVGYWPLNDARVDGSALKVSDLTGNFSGTLTGAVLAEDSTLPVS